jgi:hypothetical protein
MLIGIAGPAGCGKDTVGEILRENQGFNIISFAAPLKKIVCNLLGYGPEKWDDRKWRESCNEIWDCSPRHMAQTLGTEWGRHTIKESIWLDLALAEFDNADGDLDIAITDVRFRNEADTIRSPEWGGYILHVHRTFQDAPGVEINRKHPSEQGIGNPDVEDFHINNFGTAKDLEAQVNQVVYRILKLQEQKLQEQELQNESV